MKNYTRLSGSGANNEWGWAVRGGVTPNGGSAFEETGGKSDTATPPLGADRTAGCAIIAWVRLS